jgi:hypothetical protein
MTARLFASHVWDSRAGILCRPLFQRRLPSEKAGHAWRARNEKAVLSVIPAEILSAFEE